MPRCCIFNGTTQNTNPQGSGHGSESSGDHLGPRRPPVVVHDREPRESDEEDAEHGERVGTIVLPGGKIKVYVREADEELFAIAECGQHGSKCKKQRQLTKAKRWSRATRAKGRPFGYLGAWLRAGLDPTVGNAMQHKWDVVLTREDRKNGRREVEAAPGYADVNDLERSPRGSESDGEPFHQP